MWNDEHVGGESKLSIVEWWLDQARERSSRYSNWDYLDESRRKAVAEKCQCSKFGTKSPKLNPKLLQGTSEVAMVNKGGVKL